MIYKIKPSKRATKTILTPHPQVSSDRGRAPSTPPPRPSSRRAGKAPSHCSCTSAGAETRTQPYNTHIYIEFSCICSRSRAGEVRRSPVGFVRTRTGGVPPRPAPPPPSSVAWLLEGKKKKKKRENPEKKILKNDSKSNSSVGVVQGSGDPARWRPPRRGAAGLGGASPNPGEKEKKK